MKHWLSSIEETGSPHSLMAPPPNTHTPTSLWNVPMTTFVANWSSHHQCNDLFKLWSSKIKGDMDLSDIVSRKSIIVWYHSRRPFIVWSIDMRIKVTFINGCHLVFINKTLMLYVSSDELHGKSMLLKLSNWSSYWCNSSRAVGCRCWQYDTLGRQH